MDEDEIREQRLARLRSLYAATGAVVVSNGKVAEPGSLAFEQVLWMRVANETDEELGIAKNSDA